MGFHKPHGSTPRAAANKKNRQHIVCGVLSVAACWLIWRCTTVVQLSRISTGSGPRLIRSYTTDSAGDSGARWAGQAPEQDVGCALGHAPGASGAQGRLPHPSLRPLLGWSVSRTAGPPKLTSAQAAMLARLPSLVGVSAVDAAVLAAAAADQGRLLVAVTQPVVVAIMTPHLFGRGYNRDVPG